MKKRVLRIAVLLLAAIALVFAGIHRWQSREGIRFVKKLGNGINLGNSLDAHGASKHKETPTVEDYETYWHNPPISDALLQAVKEAGIELVRIPVTWEEHLDEDGRVDASWIDRVDHVVRSALDLGLYVIVDTHHESWLDLSADREAAERKFAELWEQIASRFADCGEKLLFEGVNEPRLRGGELEWTGGNENLRDRVDRLNQLFVKTVRSSGGQNNEERWLLLATYANQADEEALRALILPDKRCIASVHLYEPYDFCQKDNGTAQWDPEGKGAKKLASAWERIRKCLTRRGIPVIITECGCIDKGNEADRVLWVQAFRKGAKSCHAACIWWDNGNEYRMLDRKTGKAYFPRLLQAFIQN